MPPIRQPLTPYFQPSVFSFRADTDQAAADGYVFSLLHPTSERDGHLVISREDALRIWPGIAPDPADSPCVSSAFFEERGAFVGKAETAQGNMWVIANEKQRMDGFTLAYLFTRRVGILRRAYYMEEVAAFVPYTLYVPTAYDPAKPLPMAVMLHGLGGPVIREDVIPVLAANAEKHGYLICAPSCYTRGMHGSMFPMARDCVPDDVDPDNPAGLDEEQLKIYPICEKADMTAVSLTLDAYSVDRNRLYLFGNSMGGDGTFHLGQKYCELWRAIAPCGGASDLRFYPYERLRNLPTLVVAGTEDSGYELLRGLCRKLEELGVPAEFLPVGGEPHAHAWVAVMDRIFDFFDAHSA